ncbi:hypothetical protein V6N13_079240 [Hibiscus sabdariffa]|uniref:histone acetyltransferase n=1 Tax=Hibiscus sabdariffa TaxID=183260 RepID=A0ABR2RR22_9ROSI
MAPSTDIPNLQFQIPFEAEARCPFTGQNQSFRPVNKQAATHGHLSQLPFTRQNQSFRHINEQAATQDHLSRLPFTGQNQSLCPINKRAVTHGHHPQFPTGQNQSFYPINEQAVIHGHLPQLPFEESQASSGNLNKMIIQTKVLLAHFQHKKSVMFAWDDTPFSFLNHMHSTVCCRCDCTCPEFYLIASHYEGEGDFDQQPLPKSLKLENPTSPCLPCNGMFYGMAPSEAQPSFTEIPTFVQLQESLKSSNSKIMEANIKLLPKLLEDFTISEGMGMAQFQVQPSSTDLPPLVQLPEFSVSCNFEVMEANIELQPKLLEDSTVAKGMGKNMEVNTELLPKLIEDFTSAKESSKTMEANTELLSKLVEDSICSYKEEDIAFVIGTDNADNARDHFNKMEFNALTILSEELAARCEKGETKARANSNQAELMKTELISQQLNCGKETKLESQKQRGVSLIENFTAQQIKEHISSLRKYIDQDLGKKERQNGIANVDSKESCQFVERLSFQLCGRCHDEKQSTYKDSTHPLWNGEKHSLCMNMVDGVPLDTDDKDICIDNGLFEDRYKFLMFCQKNNYQFDTLRRAKHSSMMILYYLHNPKAWIASSNCCICNKDAPIDKCWHCETCLDFFVCAACYRKDGCSLHIHKLTSHSFDVDSSTENRETAMNDILSKLLEVLLHAARCRCCCRCSYPCCDLMRKLFSHSKRCTVRAPGGCMPCKKIWFMLILHSRNCQESDSAVPRDIKQHAIGIEECGILKELGRALGI